MTWITCEDLQANLESLRQAVMNRMSDPQPLPYLWRAQATVDWFITGKPQLLHEYEWRCFIDEYDDVL